MNNSLIKNTPAQLCVGQFFKNLLLFLVCVLLFKLLFLSGGVSSFFGYSPFIITSSSMEPAYPAYSLTIVKKVDFNKLNEGDVIAFKSDALGGALALHRISKLTDNGAYTKGDNNNYDDNQLVTKNTFVGKSVASFKWLGHYVTTIKTFNGFVLFFALPVFIVFLLDFSIKTLKNNQKIE